MIHRGIDVKLTLLLSPNSLVCPCEDRVHDRGLQLGLPQNGYDVTAGSYETEVSCRGIQFLACDQHPYIIR